MKSILLLVLATAASMLTGCQTMQIDTEPLEIKVMTFNFRYDTERDGENRWENRKDFLSDVIRDYSPDVLGVQEANRHQLDDVNERLPEYAEVGVGRDGGTRGEYSAVLYRKERFDLTAEGTFWLSKTPTKPSQDWGSACRRICTWARLTDKESRQTFFFYNTHLDHRSQEARAKGVEVIMTHASERNPKAPLILTGDLNAPDNNPVIEYLKGNSPSGKPHDVLVDSFRILHPEEKVAGTYHGFKGGPNGRKIDYILVTPNIKTLEASILRTDKNGRYPSDHFPVTATVRIGEKKEY